MATAHGAAQSNLSTPTPRITARAPPQRDG